MKGLGLQSMRVRHEIAKLLSETRGGSERFGWANGCSHLAGQNRAAFG